MNEQELEEWILLQEYQSEMNPYEEWEDEDRLKWDEYNYNYLDELYSWVQDDVDRIINLILKNNINKEEEKELNSLMDQVKRPFMDYGSWLYSEYYGRIKQYTRILDFHFQYFSKH